MVELIELDYINGVVDNVERATNRDVITVDFGGRTVRSAHDMSGPQ